MQKLKSLQRTRVLLRALILLSIALCLTSSMQAQRRDFAGSYKLSDIEKSGDSYSLTLTVTIHNALGDDIHDGSIALYSTLGPGAVPVDTFDVIKLLPSYKSVTVSKQFTIPESEYDRWSRGENPNLKFLLPDDGNTLVVDIDLSRQIPPAAIAE
jgi:hypothetical protein